jgi:hypothetical protein
MNPNPSPYEIIIICSIGSMVVGCLFIWGCERICHRYVVARKQREPLLNLLENGVGISSMDGSRTRSLSSGSESSSGSETTSFFTTNVC